VAEVLRLLFLHLKKNLTMRPLQNAHFCSSSRKVKILTTGIHKVFRVLKFEPDAGIGQKGALCKGLTILYA
jgi:hypothetical protein